jgi:predicted transcriptional regulator
MYKNLKLIKKKKKSGNITSFLVIANLAMSRSYSYIIHLVRKDVDVNEHERLFNFKLRHKLK